MKVELSNTEILDIYSQLEVEMTKNDSSQLLETRYENMKETVNHILTMIQFEESAVPYNMSITLKRLYEELYNINLTLYNTQGIMKTHEKHDKFGDDYIELCRGIFELNEEKTETKKRIASIVDLLA